MSGFPTYVLITPARNEGQFLELTMRSVVSQTVPPLKWLIVSDGSTDGTDDIVLRYARMHPWIELVRMPERRERHFAGKVHAFTAGYAKLGQLSYDVIGNLDGDVSFDEHYFEFILPKFAENPRLGVAGTPFTEGSRQYDYRFTSVEHVSGQCQLFRRECFEEIGGYLPRKIGGIDLVAVLTARMRGWQTRTFFGKTYVHHRRMSTATQNVFKAAFKGGFGDYVLGSHPLWQLCRCLYQMTRPPIVLSGLLRWVGYCYAMLSGASLDVPADLVAFRRKEQMQRLRAFYRKAVKGFVFKTATAFQRS